MRLTIAAIGVFCAVSATLDAVPPSHPVAPAARGVVESWEGSSFLDAVESTTLQSGGLIFSARLNRLIQNTFSDVLGSHAREADSNVLLHALDFAFTGYSGVPPSRDNFSGTDRNVAMSRAFDEAVAALVEAQGDDPTAWTAPRGDTVFRHLLAGEVGRIPEAGNRTTYGQIVILNPPGHQRREHFLARAKRPDAPSRRSKTIGPAFPGSAADLQELPIPGDGHRALTR